MAPQQLTDIEILEILALRQSGLRISDIRNQTGVPRKTICFWLRRWKESETIEGHWRQLYQRATTAQQDAEMVAAHEAQPFLSTTRTASQYKGYNAGLLPMRLPVTYTPDAVQQRPQTSVSHIGQTQSPNVTANLHNLTPNAHANLGPSAQTYAIPEALHTRSQSNSLNNSRSASHESNLAENATADINVSVNPANNNNIHEEIENDVLSDDGTQQVVDVRATIQMMIKYAPFYLILFIKLMYDSRETIFSFSILFITFSHSNTIVRREHGKQANRSILALFCELIFTSCTVALIHYFFGHGKLLPNVIMFPGYTEPIDIWELLWLVVLTDLIVRIITVDLKIAVTMTPAVLLPFQKRGKVYLFLESVSQLYRSLLTIQPWVFFLMGSYTGSEKVVGMFLTSVYAVAKLVDLLMRMQLFKTATAALLQSVNLGTKPTGEQMHSAGDSCPICHDEYSTPVRLACTHIFCELCISAWLDREHTCPLCRAKVADEPTWRDGSTTYDFQLY